MSTRRPALCGRYMMSPNEQRHSVWEGVWEGSDLAAVVGSDPAVHRLGDAEDDSSVLMTLIFPETITFIQLGPDSTPSGPLAHRNPLMWYGSEPDAVIECPDASTTDGTGGSKYFQRLCFLTVIDPGDPESRVKFDTQDSSDGATFRWEDRDGLVAWFISPLRTTAVEGASQLVEDAEVQADREDFQPSSGPASVRSEDIRSMAGANEPAKVDPQPGSELSCPGTLTIGDVSARATASVTLPMSRAKRRGFPF